MSTQPNFSINGNALPDPTSHNWEFPSSRGIDGEGNQRYEPFYSYRLQWDYLTAAEYGSLWAIWNGQYRSGTSEVNLPGLNLIAGYTFTVYTGTIMDKPTYASYYDNYYQGVIVNIRNIFVGNENL